MDEGDKLAFVAWDTTAFALKKDILPALRRKRLPGWSIAIGGARRRSGDLAGTLEEDLRRAHKVVVLLDEPNANVGIELGLSLALGKEIVLGRVGSTRPAWVARPPLDGFLDEGAASAQRIVELVGEVPGFTAEREPEVGKGTLVLCPRATPGEDYHELIEEWCTRHPEWRALEDPDSGWNLVDLPEKLAGLRRIVWVVLPFEAGSDRRDGKENAAHSVLAGYWKGLERELVVLRHEEARDIVDVGREDRLFPGLDGFERELERLVGPESPADAAADVLAVYLAQVAEEHRRLPSLFSLEGVEVPDVHVELEFDELLSGEEAHELRELQGRMSLVRTLRELLELRREDDPRVTRRWVVLGDPGAGKSTACRFLCHVLAQPAEGARGPTDPVPVFATLAELVGSRPEESLHPFALAERSLRASRGELHANGLERELFELANEPGRVWIFLDGLDELEEERRGRARDRIASWQASLEHCVLVVASRSAGFQSLPEFREARVRPLDRGRQQELLRRWLGQRWRRVWDELAARPSLCSLCENPMLLSLVAYARVEGGQGARIPDTRRGLYEQAIRVLLERGHGRKRGGVANRYRCEQVLPFLALELQRGGGEHWERDELERTVDELPAAYPERRELEGFLETWNHAPDRFLDDVAERSGLIAPHEGDRKPWRWLHRSIGEFLAAQALEELGDFEERAGKLEDAPRWGEVYGHLCALVEGPSKRLERLQRLARASPELALKALPEVEGLEMEGSYELLKEVREKGKDHRLWDGDHLLALVRSWRREGREIDGIGEFLWASLRPDDPLEHVAFVHYALEGLDQQYPLDALRRCIAARPGTKPRPTEPVWKPIPAPDSEVALTFEMGAAESEGEATDDPLAEDLVPFPWERPVQRFTLASFLMAPHPVTKGEYTRFDPSHESERSDLPVVEVDWWEAWLYCRWLGGTLPTEAQWEYACRAGTTTRYWSGDAVEDLARIGWYGNNSGGKRHPVGELDANPFGLYDMHGNVHEWCRDWIGSYETDPVRGPDCEREVHGTRSRVSRGGYFGLPAGYARSAYRFSALPGCRNFWRGFRPASSRH